ncbi:PspC domain-containing protein [Candidatus Oscillochloris fontis]|uniref:PspC domain-containing protein n=1 Tax=Candidatus Oscillochloris fontis TaxID=2496868 RepID=UPI00101D546A|nr:PspC domain-containing protein [Candidatus Oscillochloris fontis]
MQPRLTRSATETMIAGVCGGLAEYFNIDPVIVRLIFVLVTLTSGIGLPVYLLLWIVMPRPNATTTSHTFQQGVEQFSREASRFGQEVSQEAARIGREVLRQGGQSQGHARSGVATQAPLPPDYRFDPVTGQPINPERSATGETVNLNMSTPYNPMPQQPTRNWRTLGMILIGIGGLIFLEQVGLDMSLIFPALLIFAGFFLLRRKR